MGLNVKELEKVVLEQLTDMKVNTIAESEKKKSARNLPSGGSGEQKYKGELQ